MPRREQHSCIQRQQQHWRTVGPGPVAERCCKEPSYIMVAAWLSECCSDGFLFFNTNHLKQPPLGGPQG